MPAVKSKPATDGETSTTGRFTIQLPKDIRPLVESMRDDMADALHKQHGMAIDLSLTQIVTSAIRTQYADMQAAKQAAQVNGATHGTTDTSADAAGTEA